ncbi:hypothetical protein [Streptomyces bugieae]|uniref:Serine/arginine repetitive matrix protein 2 n=1 Tax=Streptomyces bugieae TaxID=3098223 RepID=A0ABU7NQP3_9ACTN|nr:hypothetical protein [Streptomyces sp. DSM 41528]
MRRGGPARWNDETQSWEDGRPAPAPYSGPMPPRPTFAPSAGAPPQPPSGPLPGTAPGATPDPFAGVPGAAPAPGPGPGPRRRTALIAGVAVAVIGAGAGGGYLLWSRDGDAPPAARTRASAPHTPTAATTPSGADSTPPTDAAPSPAVPAGYRLVHDAKGFTLAVPDGWERSERKTGVFYTAPDDRGLLQIFEITEPDIAPREALEQASKGLAGNPGFEQISLGAFDGPAPGSDAAQLVYAYDSERLGTRVKVVDCAFTTDDGRQFAVLVLGTEADWPLQQETQRIALQAFVPEG